MDQRFIRGIKINWDQSMAIVYGLNPEGGDKI